MGTNNMYTRITCKYDPAMVDSLGKGTNRENESQRMRNNKQLG